MFFYIILAKEQVKIMVWYEWKKIFGSLGGKIVLFLYFAVNILACWLAVTGSMNSGTEWVNEQGEQEYGLSAVNKMKDAQNEWEGYLNQEKLTRVLEENARINATPEGQSTDIHQSNIAYSWKQGFLPIRELINRSYASDFRSYDYYTADHLTSIDENTFYDNRTRLLEEWLYDETDVGNDLYTETEKNYLIGQYEKMENPLYFEYHNGWFQLLSNSSLISMLGILLLGFLLAGIFSNEFKWKTDSVYFSTLCGKNKATLAKIKAGFILVTVLYWFAMLIYSLFVLSYLGFDGIHCMVQLSFWKSVYNLTMGQAWGITLICGYIGNLFLATLTMFVSAKTKSSVIAVTIPFVIMFIPSFLQGISGWLDIVVSLMPVSLLEFYNHLTSFHLMTIFGNVYRVMDICIPLYFLLTLLLVPVIYREYRRKQIE